MSAQPWMKFYPTNWRADPALRMCSIGARGLWMEMLCLMHEANPRGSLTVNGQPVSDRQLAALAGISLEETSLFLAEMESAGVFSRDGDGTIFSRRMRRETTKSEEGRLHGAKGGNPALVKSEVKGQDEVTLKGHANPSLASGNGTLASEVKDARTKKAERSLEFAETFWPKYPNRVGKPKALLAFVAARDRADLATIMAGVERYIRGKPPDRPWLNPQTFLNQDRWTDEPGAVAQIGETKPLTPSAEPTVWIDRDDARWSWAANKYEMGRGRQPVPAGSRNRTGIGFEFPASCVPLSPNRKEQEAA